MFTRSLASALLMTLIAHASFADSDRQFIKGDASPAIAKLPFSDGVLVGDTLYIGGHIGIDAKTGLAPPDPKLEAKLVMERVKATVEAAGLGMADIVSIQVYCTDLSLYDTFNEVYKGYFTDHFPARAFVGAATLLRQGHYEVLGVAVRHGKH